MSHAQPIRLVDSRGRKYLTADERARFLAAAARAAQPADQTFALTPAHTGARVSEILALRAHDIDTAAIRIRTLKRRAEHWREIPIPPELLRALELVHALRSLGPRAAAKPLWPLSRATAHRRAQIPRRHEMQRLGGGRSRAGIRVGSVSSRTVPRCRQRPKLSRHSTHADNSAGVAKLVDERESSVIIWQQ